MNKKKKKKNKKNKKSEFIIKVPFHKYSFRKKKKINKNKG
jgi:hypothetical protein